MGVAALGALARLSAGALAQAGSKDERIFSASRRIRAG